MKKWNFRDEVGLQGFGLCYEGLLPDLLNFKLREITDECEEVGVHPSFGLRGEV